jgi:SAM-dependent methyltransferase
MSNMFSGSGPGIQTADGCSVEFYRQLPYMNELEDVVPQLPAGGTVLELGCGTGRLCNRLVDLGFRVTGVDESAEMLAALPPAVISAHSSIGALELAEVFDAVLLPSHRINHPSTTSREAFVRCARRHLNVGGRFLLQRHDPEWLRIVKPGPVGRTEQIALHVEAVYREKATVSMTIRYDLLGQAWQQSFSTVPLSEAQIEALLGRFGFAQVQWHGSARLWASAVAI